ncbi:MAG: GrdX family protein [Cetobacterium sp.]
MEYLIITNNPLVRDSYGDVLFVSGNVKEVLITTRTMVHSGAKLLTHPLAASLRMLLSPYRTIVVSKEEDQIDSQHLEIIESSIYKYNQHMEVRKVDLTHREDYSLIDFTLLNSAFEELSRFS